MTYDPRLQALLAEKEDDWGTPEDNQKNMLLYGFKPLDQRLYGMNLTDGELIVVKGQEKRRKTTFVMNVLINMMSASIPVNKPTVVVDSLESGMGPKRWRDQLISMVATRVLLEDGHLPGASCPRCGSKCRHIGLNPEYLRYHKRTKEQLEAINLADQIMEKWPVLFFGAPNSEGNTRDLNEAVTGRGVSEDSWHVVFGAENKFDPKKELARLSRWHFLIKYFGAKIFITDHVQQYRYADSPTDYEKQLRAVGAHSDLVASEKIIEFLISQVSLTSVREARQTIGRIVEAGGPKASAEANVIFSTQYSQTKGGEMWVVLEESRRSGSFSMRTGIEDVSGLMYGEPELKFERIFVND